MPYKDPVVARWKKINDRLRRQKQEANCQRKPLTGVLNINLEGRDVSNVEVRNCIKKYMRRIKALANKYYNYCDTKNDLEQMAKIAIWSLLRLDKPITPGWIWYQMHNAVRYQAKFHGSMFNVTKYKFVPIECPETGFINVGGAKMDAVRTHCIEQKEAIEDRIIARIDREWMYRTLKQLSPSQRRAVVCSELSPVTTREWARRLNKTEGLITRDKNTGLTLLALLERECYNPKKSGDPIDFLHSRQYQVADFKGKGSPHRRKLLDSHTRFYRSKKPQIQRLKKDW